MVGSNTRLVKQNLGYIPNEVGAVKPCWPCWGALTLGAARGGGARSSRGNHVQSYSSTSRKRSFGEALLEVLQLSRAREDCRRVLQMLMVLEEFDSVLQTVLPE
jgi:hypothetical protein